MPRKKTTKDPANGGAWIELEEDKLIKLFHHVSFCKKNPGILSPVEDLPSESYWKTSEWVSRFKSLFKKMREAGVEPSPSAQSILAELEVRDVMES